VDPNIGLLGAFGGGVISFASPCVLPLVPAYLSVITGLNVATLQDGGRRHLRQVLVTAGGFVAGFSAVFVLLGLTATALGRALNVNQTTLTRVSGVIVLAMALFIVASHVLDLPWLYQEARWRPSAGKFGPFAAPIAGVAFGFGWTPCIGPVLSSVIAISATSGQLGRGAALLLAYSMGLAVPLLAAALAMDRVSGAMNLVKQHLTGITLASAAILGVLGTFMALGQLHLVASAMEWALTPVTATVTWAVGLF
jgi:cytochrome c-type biogenesis protein